ncbi:MAG: CocE/NonD family hydrolase [bacterium]
MVYRPAGVRMLFDVKVPMRDGVRLSADIYFPRWEGPFPAILSRTPYDNTNLADAGVFFAQHGYAFIAQDVRGRFDSEGEFYPWVNEARDGYDTLEWVGGQPWCDGNVGMYGGSYVGMVQWLAASQGSSYLKTIVPEVIGSNPFESPHYTGGAFQLGVSSTWSLATSGRTAQKIDLYDWDRLFRTLPLRELDSAAGRNVPYLRDWIAHSTYDDYWKALSNQGRYQDVKVPVLHIGGWYDIFVKGTIDNFCGMRERGGSPTARENQKLIVGPWIHSASKLTYAGRVDYGTDSVLDLRAIELRWFDRWLKGIENGIMSEPPIKIFVMGKNIWRDEMEWPPSRARYTPYYFHSGGRANSLRGDGYISESQPRAENADEFTYDPQSPVTTTGGCTCCNPDILPWGARDQREVESREDVLVYTSDPLREDLEVTGPVKVILYASTDVPDTDFTAKLVDVDTTGYAVNICDGIIRTRYRESWENPKLLEPGKIYKFEIDLWATSNVFLRGHRIRVEVSSSNFPRFDRNLNTGGELGTEDRWQVAHQRIYHDAERPSHILLPIVPA